MFASSLSSSSSWPDCTAYISPSVWHASSEWAGWLASRHDIIISVHALPTPDGDFPLFRNNKLSGITEKEPKSVSLISFDEGKIWLMLRNKSDWLDSFRVSHATRFSRKLPSFAIILSHADPFQNAAELSFLLKAAARVLSFFLSQGTLQAICSAKICKLQLFVFYSMAAFLFFCEEMAASEDYIGRTSRPLLSANKKMGGRCLTFRSL